MIPTLFRCTAVTAVSVNQPKRLRRPSLPAALAFTVFLCLASAPIAAPASAQTPEEAAAFRTVISAQVDAFRAEAWDRAFSFASPDIRTLFGDSDRFRAMVMGGYEAVARPEVFKFEEATVMNGRPTQPVFVIGPDGIARRALYFMERQPDGSWKIDGVVLEDLPDRTT
ncbi:DUF4864 domain-containing protein [Thalassobaculum sp.]|uniref:DUF4864 domain-containing protein n=1 Tax=Thalassobaculum sp. TaxID=2022740 RepID=UPI0032ED4121